MTRLAVLGSPIAHSKSPALHRAAYEALGLDWQYDAIDVTTDALADFVETRGADWRGLSLTMPLKRAVLPLLGTLDEFTELTGGANTLLFRDGVRHGFNTDVIGAIDALVAAGIGSVDGVRILGGGATAASMVVAVARLGAKRLALAVRSPDRAGAIIALCERLDLPLELEDLGAASAEWTPDLVVSTLPNGTGFVLAPIPGVALFDVAYEPWPTTVAAPWLAAGLTVIPGIELLLRQAVAQVRIFVGGSPSIELPGEPGVVAAMREAS
ncbi:MAG: shikimate dehydrogenase [Microbacteriaceae bacterium]|nr:shikimate dehydrogenase [Microbacteriaceae bacterium]